MTSPYLLTSSTVGSQAQGSYFEVFKLSISSFESSKSYKDRFSSIRLCVSLLGKMTKFFCSPQRSRICDGCLLYFLTSGCRRGSSIRVALTSGEYASKTMPRFSHQLTMSSLASQGCNSTWFTERMPPLPSGCCCRLDQHML